MSRHILSGFGWDSWGTEPMGFSGDAGQLAGFLYVWKRSKIEEIVNKQI